MFNVDQIPGTRKIFFDIETGGIPLQSPFKIFGWATELKKVRTEQCLEATLNFLINEIHAGSRLVGHNIICYDRPSNP